MIIILFFKGLICGIGIIIPGFSFSSLALMIDIYDELLFSINNFFKNPKMSLKTLVPFFLGAIASCLILFYPINFLLNSYPLILIMFFSGLLIGGFISLFKRIKAKDFLISIMSFVIFFSLNYFFSGNYNVNLSEMKYSSTFIIFLTSICCAFASLAPSLSITFILINFGLYTSIVELIDSTLHLKFEKLLNLNIWINLFSLFIFFVSFVFIFARIISNLLNKHQSKTIAFFLGSSYATLWSAFFNSSININPFNKNINLWYYYAISVIFLILGLILVLRIENKKT